MIQLRPGLERGHNQLDWLDTYHTFSFDRYYDPAHMGFRQLRVLNEDRIAPGKGFGTHPHRDMEILTYVLEGALAHRDSTGGGGVLRPNELQRMSAGTGVTHSEFNHSSAEPVHLLQIWILPESKSLQPGYEQRAFPPEELRGRFQLLAGPEGPVKIHQNAQLFVAKLELGQQASHPFKKNRFGWLQIARGKVRANGLEMNAGDGAAFSEEEELKCEAKEPAELLLFDLA